MADSPGLYFVQNVGLEALPGTDPALYAALNIGLKPLPGTDPALYAALNIGAEVLVGKDPSLYSAQNPGDYDASDLSDTLGPEFTFAPYLGSLTPDFGQEGVEVTAEGIGFGDERVFVRWEGLAGGGEAGPVVIGNFGEPWTAETWFRAQERGQHDEAPGISTGYLLRIQDVSGTKFSVELDSGKVKIARDGGNSVTTSGTYDDGDWHLARLVQDAGKMHLLVDGIPQGSAAAADVTVDRLIIGDEDLKADQRMVRVQSANEGTSIYTPVWDFTADVRTLALYYMDELSGSTLIDYSTSGNDVSIGGTENTDWRRIDWDFEVDVKLKAQIQGLDTAKVRNYELKWTVAVGAESGPVSIEHTVVHADTSNTKPFTALAPEPLRGIGFEVRVYDKDNFATLLDIFENAYEISFTVELNAAGAGRFKLNLHDSKATATNLAHGNLIRIFLDGLERFAFRIEGTREDTVTAGEDSTKVVTVSGRGLLSMLDDAIIYPPNWPSSEPIAHEFIGASPGEIMKTFVDAAVARGALSGVTVDFDDSDDSSGTPWASTYILDYYPGQTLSQVMEQLVGLGSDIRMTSGSVLQFYNELGLNRASGSDPTIFAQGDNLLLHTRDGSSTEVKNTMLLLRGDVLMEQSTPSDFPRREAFIDTRQTEDLTTAQELAIRTLETMSDVNDSFDAEVISAQGHSEAFIDWDVGDTVYVETEDDGRVEYRIRAVTVQQTDNGRPQFVCTLGNMRYEYLIRLKRMIDMFTGGTLIGSSGGGVVGTATPSLIGLYIETPADAKYVTLEAHLGLTKERILTAGLGVTITDGGAGNAVTIDHDAGDFGDVHTNYIEHDDISEASGFLLKTGAGAYEAVKANTGAAVDPGVDDDNTQGYTVSSRWFNTTDDKEFVCLDASTGAAVWLQTSGTGSVAAHVLATTGPHTGTLPWSDLNKAGSSLADLATRTHASLSDAPADAHHAAFTQADADLLYEALGDIAIHAAIAGAHHAKYLDSEAIAAVEGEATLDLGGDVSLAADKTLALKTDGATGGLKLGAGSDVHLFRGAANRLDLATGDSFRVVSGELQLGADVALLRGAADRLDLKSGDNFKIVSGYFELTEIASPGNPAANDLRLFAKDVGGVTKAAVLDSAGNETILGEGTKAFAFFMG